MICCILNLTQACSWRAYNTYSHMGTLSTHWRPQRTSKNLWAWVAKVIKELMSSVWPFHLAWDECNNPTVEAHKGRHTKATVRPQHTIRSIDAWALPGMQGWKWSKMWQQNRNWVRRRHASGHTCERLENPNYTASCNLPLSEHAAKVGRDYHILDVETFCPTLSIALEICTTAEPDSKFFARCSQSRVS